MNHASVTSTGIDNAAALATVQDDSVAARASWRYSEAPGTRDLRIDYLRGLAIVFVVVDHVELNSAFHLLSHERIGAVSGAELFVLLSGLVLGMVHRRRAIVEGWAASAARMWARAKLLYLVSLVVVIAAFLLSAVPLLNDDVLTTWTNRDTGEVYSLYGSTPLLTDYPVPPPAVFDLLFLDVGPYQFNVMGLYVVLLVLAPFALHALITGRWRLILAISSAFYAGNLILHWQIVPSSFANQFPLMSWQFLFFSGMVLGFHQQALRAWFERTSGRAVVVIAWVAFLGFLFFTWNNPAKLTDPWALRLDVIPAERFWSVYGDWFRRDFLGLLRVANVAAVLVVFYGLLTRFWGLWNRLTGWFFVPMGGATLYVFILHVAFAIVVASLPFVNHTSLLVGTLTHAAVLALMWAMVRSQFLFRWIPR